MLKRIELKGFKSFADKTVIDFDRGVSCIVGPNGSGKSNITDAFRWVLGEQSYKSLRGTQMTDVIFGGTLSREALGYAEVVVVLENAEKLVDLPYEEVSIMRRLYRSGESRYSINGNACRLRDIKELFMDTGVGVEGYSIIGQGRIDKLISSGKEDRRAIFEEASGIAKYKSKKEEAIRKMEKTSSLMERILDISSELESRLDPLKEQSEKATQYLQIKNDLKSVEISLYLEDIDKIRGELDAQNKSLERYEMESEDLAEGLFAAKEKLSSLSLEIDDLRLKKQALLTQKNDLEKKKIQGEAMIKLVEERKRLSEERREILQKKLSESEAFFMDARSGREHLESLLSEIKEECERKEDGLNALKAAFDEKNGELSSLSSEIALIKAERRNFFDELARLEVQRAELKIHLDGAQKSLSALEERAIKNEASQEKRLEDLKQIQHSLNLLEEKEHKIVKERVDMDAALAEQRIEMDRVENEIYRLRLERNEIFSEKELLERRIENHEGVGEAARAVLNRAKNDSKILGTIASLIQIDKAFEIALEQILGGRAEHIVTEDFDSAKVYIDFLKKEGSGRQTFLPLDGIRANEILYLDDFRGLCGHAMDFIDCDEKVEPAIRYLLYNVSFVEDLDAAKRGRAKAPNGYKLVTLQGEVVNVGGTISGGSQKNRRSGLFSEKRKLQECESKISKKEDELKLEYEKRDRIYSELQKGQESLQEIGKILDEIKIEKMKTESLLDSERKSLSSGLEEEKRAEEEKLNLSDRMEAYRRTLEENLHLEHSLKQEQEQKLLETGERKKKLELLRNEISEATVKINEETIELNKIKFNFDNINLQLEAHLEKVAGEETRVSEMKREIEAIEIQLQRHSEDYSKYTEDVFSNARETESLSLEMNEIDVKLHDLGKVSREDLGKFKNLEKKLADLKDSMYGIRIQTGKLEARLENREQGLWEDYMLSYAGAMEFRIDISYQKAKAASNSYKAELQKLGDVNLLAIEEYKQLRDRVDFISGQKTDLQESLDKLNAIIEDMDDKMRRTFRESLEDINEKFKKTFSDLFKGGMATIELGDDSEDILEAEIVINAQPPGKKLQTIELLSGGEKALTAIAILFAILKTKPAPFCILDEIEAALDDRNISLFSGFLTDYKKDSQFIIISHRKGTIKIADALYGVTMKEKGISEILSLKLKDGIYEEI